MGVRAPYDSTGLTDGQGRILDSGKGIRIMSFSDCRERVFEDRVMKKMTLIGLIGLAAGALALFGLKWFQRLKSTSTYKS
jgi:hypothetical protein